MPERRARPWLPMTAALASVVLVVGTVIAVSFLFGGSGDEDPGTPSPGPSASTPSEPEPVRPEGEGDAHGRQHDPAEAETDGLDYGPDAPELEGTGSLAERLEALQAKYRAANDDGTLWEQIPRTRQNLSAYLAFQFILTDLKAATRFGIDPVTETQYAKHAKHLELLLLAQEPLGVSVEYTLQDGRVFRYDGETGEGGLGEAPGQ